MRRFLAPIWVLVFSSPLWAVSGTVLDSQGKAVPFARVSVLGQSGWAVANERGEFELSSVGKPPVTLLVTGPDGVLLGTFTFEKDWPSPLVLRLVPRQEAVTVTATRPPDLVLPPATAFNLVSQEDLSIRRPAQLANVLDVIPNTGGLEEGHSVVPAIRGLARFRSLILVDDTRVMTERRAGPSATFLDPSTVGEVEVVRGAAGVAYGSDAFGGVIAARTRLARPGESWSLRYHLTGATGAPEQAAALETGGALGPGALTLGVAYRNFDRYDTPKEKIYNSESTFRHARVGYQLPLGSGLFRVLWRSDWGRDIGKPALDSRVTRAYYPEENSHRLVLGYEAPLSGAWKRLSWSASWVEYQLITDRDRFATATSPRQLTRADVFAHDYNARLEAERALGSGQLLLGLDAYGRFGLKATNDTYRFTNPESPTRTRETSIASARKDDLGVFAAYHWQGQLVGFNIGLRGDHSRAKNEGGYFGNRSFDFDRGSGFVAATLRFAPGWEGAVQYSRGFRDAVLSDRFYRGISGRGFITGNPDLKPETSEQWDTSIRYQAGSWRAALYAYRYEISDFIERYRAGVDYFFRNRAKARLEGLEGELGFSLAGGLSVLLGLQYPKGKILDDHSYMDDVPARGGFVLLSQQHGSYRWETRFAAYARDTRPGPTETVRPGYAVWDLGAFYALSPSLEFGLYARNLLDRTYYVSADPNAVAAPGRAVQLSIRGVLK
ncbi:MAG: TonB-dependent receptor [Thermoanaerobaculum sp.]